MKPFALLTLAVLGLGLLVLHACQDTPELTQQSPAFTAVSRQLTVLGTGTGSGLVTSSPTGINCTITAGRAGSTGCTRLYTQGTQVTLTARPANGHAFGGWAPVINGCPTATGTCRVTMGVNRTVSALFRRGPFTFRISGTGSGTVRSQPGLTPAINCRITNGTPVGPVCSATYPASDAVNRDTVTLTATAGPGFLFAGWSRPSCGTAACQFPAIQNLTIPVNFSAIGPNDPAAMGRWEPVFTTPVVAVHTHLLPTGKVLLWGDKGGDGKARLWAPGTGFEVLAKPTLSGGVTFRIYCSGHTFLPDGRVLVAGGTSNETRGLSDAAVFNPSAGTWNITNSMAQGRYYPTTTTLPNGEILVVSGHDANLQVVSVPEVWDGSTWRRLTTAPLAIPDPYYPPMFVAPNGNVFFPGFFDLKRRLTISPRYLDVGAGQWTTLPNRQVVDRTLGSAVMYAPGKILYVGGGDPPVASAEVIDLNLSTSWRLLPSQMMHARRQTNATLLADGTVLVTGGTSGGGFNDQAGAVHVAERWNPETEIWTTMASETKNRTYHATALLLPSGRVLSSGGGEGGGIPIANSEFSAQLFTPPYLFNTDGTTAARPSITSAPPTLSYGQSLTVGTPNPASITRAHLIRNSSVTHTFNQSQLLYPLTVSSRGPTSISFEALTDRNLAPPGPYMLFLINGPGVPSVAKIVLVGP
jgi:galactose oxidase-like protein/List-Bact-rpt repeat protein